MTLPNIIRFSGGTSINGINYDEYSASTFTVTTDGSGNGTFSVVTSANTTSSTYGQKVIVWEILSSSSGSTLPNNLLKYKIHYRYTSPIVPGRSWVGIDSISATTSGTACNNISFQTMYRTDSNSNPPVSGNTLYSGDTGSTVVNGNNNWVSLVAPNVPISATGGTNTQYVVQVNTSGVITNVQTCP
jgi:hypothetical protein